MMARMPRLYVDGCSQHVVQRGNNRSACFFCEADYAFYLQKLKDASRLHGVKVHTFGQEGAYSALAKLRDIPEFAALEEKYGKLTLTFDNSKATSLDGNTLNINGSIFSREYRVDIDASVNAFEDTLSADLPDSAYWGAIDSYADSLPEFYRFSMERVLVHEAFHLMQGDVSGLKYTLNRDHLERVTIGRANVFMHKNFNEPYRVGRHSDIR